ncbi:hypothetical protein NZD89_28100 (plasmid) [Alicyclobacillus fastidiosus]|uniref:Uncharacterized protein n=1 Tax=Alicyclobacillus fastidiosus TaxID=392011 RepID=A0ABY6ZPZ1_9BACL|nr:hypothetical protein [Alicyclobacillus fastidiosus]WAH44912.1 hypothetical protein NZD89_28100 [Alicyclobacillus fastidiosus]GMA65674.1 hypothetical protein GCM10025859_61140 [Alicyclobacillus fastidiosus]
MPDQIMPYPDDVLSHLMGNFSLPHWTILDLLDKASRGELEDYEGAQLSLTDLHDYIKLSQQNFRAQVALLQGANAIALVTGVTDQRSKNVVLTDNGRRMLELRGN